MRIRPEEVALARAYVRATHLESLSVEQMKSIMDRGRRLHAWFKEHHALHCLINAFVFAFIFGLDYAVLMKAPAFFLTGSESSWPRLIAAALLCGGVHSWLLYSLSVFSAHEGAAHRIIFPVRGPFSRFFGYLAGHACRIAGAEPNHYSEHHMSHHARFGTEGDGEFLNYILPRRFWLTFLPFAAFLNYTDFIAHRPLNYTRSRLVTAVTGLLYHLLYGFFMADAFQAAYPVLAFFLFMPHIGFAFDRLRQFTEHNLMPLENKDGARSFGLGFWGMLIGGGPWGSPCHWEHHLVASLPWYQQLILHRHVTRLLTPAQRRQFLIEPVTGFPKLLWRLWREPNQFAARVAH
jgi:hypothetical protein